MKKTPIKLARLSLIVLMLCTISFSSKAQNLDKYKALLVYKVSEYIIWPEEDHVKKIGVFKDASIYKDIMSYASKRENLEIVTLTSVSDAVNCDMVFISTAHNKELYNYAKGIDKKSILLVSETKAHIQRGADLVIYVEDNKLKYLYNESKINFKGLSASSKLSSLGQSI
ncbi:YfiR family protein [Reichenbachiella versicolor]|uniref:YfiR family protein n=1 Tax=Reichenbachiella versicolor TaxID=1821036 RepID=UPI000D6E1658|nr:YfiR family protein [Reichenbachiella versicolor]